MKKQKNLDLESLQKVTNKVLTTITKKGNKGIIENYYKYVVDMSLEEQEALYQYGCNNILKDREEIINYAVIHILNQVCESLAGYVESEEELVKNTKNIKMTKLATKKH